MTGWKDRSFRVTALILLGVGLLLSLFLAWRQEHLTGIAIFLSDFCFTQFMVFMAFGTWRLLGNIHAFTFASYSFRFVHRLFRKEKTVYPDAEAAREAYRDYRDSRPVRPHAALYMAVGGAFLILSFLLAALV